MTLRPVSFDATSPAKHGERKHLAFCRAMDLFPLPEGYGFLQCLDERGMRVTAITTEPAIIAAMSDVTELAGTGAGFDLQRPGWIEDWVDEDRLT